MSIIKEKDKLLEFKHKSDELAQALSEKDFADWQSLHEILYEFILSKYFLYGACEDVYDLDTLAEMSVAKTIELSKVDSFKADSKASCEGTTSAMNKKVLLLMSIQKIMNIRFPREMTADLTDTKKIAQAIYSLKHETEEA